MEQQPIEAILNGAKAKPAKKLKTAEYTLRAVKKYEAKNADKIKARRDKTKHDKALKHLETLPNSRLSKYELILKLERLEAEMQALQLTNSDTTK